MGKPKLVWSLIQLSLENQHKIVLIGRLTGVLVNMDGVCSMADFEVIEIMDDIQPYPKFMGLIWVFDNQEIIKLKNREMRFKFESYCTIRPNRMKVIHRAIKRK
jgi:hypothetical protein